jgi:hypothetical protein
MKTLYLSIITVTVAVLVITWVMAQDRDTSMSFFVTSAGPGNGADLGGLKGADALCQKMAAAGGAASGNWRVYLSVSANDGKAAVNARDRMAKVPGTMPKELK